MQISNIIYRTAEFQKCLSCLVTSLGISVRCFHDIQWATFLLSLRLYYQLSPCKCIRRPRLVQIKDCTHTQTLTRDTAYLLTPWCRVLPEQLTDLQLVKKFPAFHGTRRFITALTSVRQLSLSWASPIQSIYPHPTSSKYVLILSPIYA